MIDQSQRRALLRAFPHPQFGGGKIHLLKDPDEDPERDGSMVTLCGQSLDIGVRMSGTMQAVTCKTCRRAVESADRWAETSEQWKREAEIREAERQERRRQWWNAYERYLQSPTWYEKRRRVMERAGKLCEGCRNATAVQVHHLRYPTGVTPGSKEWIRMEKLFDLVAVCKGCHDDRHHDINPEAYSWNEH